MKLNKKNPFGNGKKMYCRFKEMIQIAIDRGILELCDGCSDEMLYNKFGGDCPLSEKFGNNPKSWRVSSEDDDQIYTFHINTL